MGRWRNSKSMIATFFEKQHFSKSRQITTPTTTMKHWDMTTGWADKAKWGSFPHPILYKFPTFIREIFKTSAWIGHFGGRNGIFLFVNLGTGGTLWILGSFSAHAIPYKSSRKIREIFKISCWMG